MSIIRDTHTQYIICDEVKCRNETDEFERDEFQLMIDVAKETGWYIHKEGDEWQHTCPDCLPRMKVNGS